jgi:hypothetical protein
MPAASQYRKPLPQWSAEANYPVSSYYVLPEAHKPKRVKIGRRLFILESPDEWVARLAALGGAPARQAA